MFLEVRNAVVDFLKGGKAPANTQELSRLKAYSVQDIMYLRQGKELVGVSADGKAEGKAVQVKQYEESATICLPLSKLLNQPVAILCARYWYRGILVQVGKDFAILDNAKAVETTGASSSVRPDQEDPIPSLWCVSLDAVEAFGQPLWCFADFQAFQFVIDDAVKVQNAIKAAESRGVK